MKIFAIRDASLSKERDLAWLLNFCSVPDRIFRTWYGEKSFILF